MDKNDILLSICIPTYNECRYLENVVKSIVIQKEFIDKKVEIIVTDNASTDKTDCMIKKYTDNFDNIKYIKNEKNIGSTDNTTLAVSYAIGKFVKISTSSTIYDLGSLTTMLNYIEKYQDENIQLYFTNDNSADDVILSFKEFAYETAVQNTNYLSWGLWKRDIVDFLNDQKYNWTNIPACYFNLKYAHKYGKVLIVNKKLFTPQKRTPKDLTYGLFNTFAINIYDIHNEFIQNGVLNKDFIIYLKKKIGYWLIPWVVYFEFKDSDYKYAESENLKNDFIVSYKNEKYFILLYLSYLKFKVRYFLNRLLSFSTV